MQYVQRILSGAEFQRAKTNSLYSYVTSSRPLLRGTILNGTYGTDKNLPGTWYIFCSNNIWSYQVFTMVPRNTIQLLLILLHINTATTITGDPIN